MQVSTGLTPMDQPPLQHQIFLNISLKNGAVGGGRGLKMTLAEVNKRPIVAHKCRLDWMSCAAFVLRDTVFFFFTGRKRSAIFSLMNFKI